MSLARWLNSALTSERGSRSSRRAFVRYPDLLADWRPVMLALADQLGLTYAVDPNDPRSCAVDAWIEPTLRRHEPTWDGLSVPSRLVEIADESWACLDSLADPANETRDVHARLDRCYDAYVEIKTESWNLVQDEARAARYLSNRLAEREAREAVARKLVRLRRRAKRAEAELQRHGLVVPTSKGDADSGSESGSDRA